MEVIHTKDSVNAVQKTNMDVVANSVLDFIIEDCKLAPKPFEVFRENIQLMQSSEASWYVTNQHDY